MEDGGEEMTYFDMSDRLPEQYKPKTRRGFLGKLIVEYDERTVVFTHQAEKLMEGYDIKYFAMGVATLCCFLKVTHAFIHKKYGKLSIDFLLLETQQPLMKRGGK